jgi:dihydroneopterin aldolase
VSDRIELRGLRVLALCGVLPEERERAQPFEIDLDVEADLSAAGRSDALDDTIDYGRLCADVERVATDEQFGLLERFAQRIADVVLADPLVLAVTVSVRKLRPPVPQQLATSGVCIRRASSGRFSSSQ